MKLAICIASRLGDVKQAEIGNLFPNVPQEGDQTAEQQIEALEQLWPSDQSAP